MVTFPSVFEGPFSVQVTDSKARGGRISAVLAGADTTLDVTVRLTVTGTVSGRFLMPDRTTPIPFAVVRLMGYRTHTAVLAGLGLTQIGEFSYILVGVGRATDLVTDAVYNAVLATSLVSILVNAMIFRRSPRWLREWVSRRQGAS